MPRPKIPKAANTASQFSALLEDGLFPAFILCGYLGFIAYFKSKGGYRDPVDAHHAGAQPG
jgi:hypothetical protein